MPARNLKNVAGYLAMMSVPVTWICFCHCILCYDRTVSDAPKDGQVFPWVHRVPDNP